MPVQSNVPDCIPPEVLAEQWFGFVHQVIGRMQTAYRATHITQKEIAAKLGKKPSFISRCLSGQENMTLRTIHDLGRAMNCRLEITFQPLASLPVANRQPIPRSPIPEPPASTTTPAIYGRIPNPSVTSGTILR
jgi:hypothetical protein